MIIQLGRAFYGRSTYRRRKTVLIFETSEKAWAATRKDLLQHNINQTHHEKVRGNDNKVLKIPLNENIAGSYDGHTSSGAVCSEK